MKICHINFIRQIFKVFAYKERKIIQEEGKIRKILVHIHLSTYNNDNYVNMHYIYINYIFYINLNITNFCFLSVWHVCF